MRSIWRLKIDIPYCLKVEEMHEPDEQIRAFFICIVFILKILFRHLLNIFQNLHWGQRDYR